MENNPKTRRNLGAAITRAASLQSYYTARFLVDRPRISDAFRAYGYFRWVDDCLDAPAISEADRLSFVGRQQALMEALYRDETPQELSEEEFMLVELIRSDADKDSGLHAYIRNLMAVMVFDAGRRGRWISADELATYERHLATAVTEALHYFIGHCCTAPRDERRYLAATGAHITHMLRDTVEDTESGYYNIPRQYLEAHHIAPWDIESAAYRQWVRSRVQLARRYFQAGRGYLAQVENLRCRLAGYAYTARFEGLLDTFEEEGYQLRVSYPERKSMSGGLRFAWSLLSALLPERRHLEMPHILPVELETPREKR